MKKLLTILTAMGFTLALGVAFAGEYPTMSGEMSGNPLYNAVTSLDTGPSCELSDSGAGGSGAGGMIEGESVAIAGNGVTYFGHVEENSIANGPCFKDAAGEESTIENGITYFGPAPKKSDM